MTRLNQIIAAEGGAKKRASDTITNIYKTVQKDALFSGINRTYRPKEDEGETLPPESTIVQQTVPALVREARDAWAELIDLTITKDVGNMSAKANIVVDGQVVAQDVPVTTLLFLEKRLNDIHTFISSLPTLDPAVKWTESDTGEGVWETEPVDTTRTKKVPRNHVKAPATDKHPAQVEVYNEDVVVGFWQTIKYSGAISSRRRQDLLAKVDALAVAVKFAREEANTSEVQNVNIAQDLLGSIFL